MSWSLNVQRGFSSGLLHSSSTSIHNIASPLKGAASVCLRTFNDEQLESRQGDEAGLKQELIHSVASILRSQEGLFPGESQAGRDSEKTAHNTHGWKVWKKGEHGIMDNLIPDYAWKVLRRLHQKGHGTYLVGGSVRDMLLKQAPKDFDVITTAELKQVKSGFSQAFIVGKRFPVCNVRIQDKIVEVSSFSTVAKPAGKGKLSRFRLNTESKELEKSGVSYWHHHARWENSMRRDFTINGLFYDPFKETLYDYLGGVEDLTKKKVRTVTPADESFREDSARILRALRIAGRLGFKFTRETAKAIQTHALSISSLPQERLRLEAKYLMSYGAAERSLRLLWRFGLLEILFPPQAAYLAAQGFKRQEKGSNMLLVLLANLDKLLSPAKPCHCSLWINLLALHLTLFYQPQTPVVIAALAFAIRGTNLEPAVLKAIKIHEKYGDFLQDFPELDRQSPKMSRAKIQGKVLELCDNTRKALQLMSNSEYVAGIMEGHPEAPSSDVVIVTKQLVGVCEELFCQVLYSTSKVGSVEKEETYTQASERGSKKKIDREALEKGVLGEVSFVFSHILMSTLYPNAAKRKKELE